MGWLQDKMDREEERKFQSEMWKLHEEAERKAEMTYVPQEATNVTDFYLVGRTFPEQKFSSYYEANKALWEIPDSVVKYDGEVGIAGYDANGELVYTYYRESMPEDI